MFAEYRTVTLSQANTANTWQHAGYFKMENKGMNLRENKKGVTACGVRHAAFANCQLPIANKIITFPINL